MHAQIFLNEPLSTKLHYNITNSPTSFTGAHDLLSIVTSEVNVAMYDFFIIHSHTGYIYSQKCKIHKLLKLHLSLSSFENGLTSWNTHTHIHTQWEHLQQCLHIIRLYIELIIFHRTIKNRGRRWRRSTELSFSTVFQIPLPSLPAGMIAEHCAPRFALNKLALVEKLQDMVSFLQFHTSFICILFQPGWKNWAWTESCLKSSCNKKLLRASLWSASSQSLQYWCFVRLS